MTDAQALLAVLAVVYLVECVFWLRGGAVALVRGISGCWCMLHPRAAAGIRSGALAMGNPLPPFGGRFICQAWPLSISPLGVCNGAAQSINPGWPLRETSRSVRFDQVRSVTCESNEIFINSEPFAKTASPALATRLAQLIERLRDMPEAQRAGALEAELREAFDTRAVAKRLGARRAVACPVKWMSESLFVLVLVIGPALCAWRGFNAVGVYVVAASLAAGALVAVACFRAHRKLEPAARAERWLHLAMMFLLPPAAIRAMDALSQHLLARFHPLAVARMLCARDDFASFAKSVVLDLRHPLPCPGLPPGHLAFIEWQRAAVMRETVRFLKRQEVDLSGLDQPPTPSDETMQTYCPRCRGQFSIPAGECPDCAGVPVRALRVRE